MKNRTFSQVNNVEFQTTKNLISAGATIPVLKRLTHRSWIVLKGIKESASLSEYKRFISSYSRKHEAKPEVTGEQMLDRSETHLEKAKRLTHELMDALDQIEREYIPF